MLYSTDGSYRNKEIDVLKALAIIMVVVGHTMAPFMNFLYLFHVAIFFMASGFTFKDKYSDSLKGVGIFVLKKIKYLWLPYFIWNSVFTILHNFFIVINVYTNDERIKEYVPYYGHDLVHDYMTKEEMMREIIKGLSFRMNTQLGVALWFLKILFTVSICYCLMEWLIKRILPNNTIMVQAVVSIVLLSIGYYCSVNNVIVPAIPQTCSFYWLFLAGVIIKKYKGVFDKIPNLVRLTLWISSTVFLFIQSGIQTISLSNNSYVNPLFFILVSLCGWIFTYYLSEAIVIYMPKWMNDTLCYIGKRTRVILVLHYLSFKIVAYFVSYYYRLPRFCVAAFPCLKGNVGIWWLVYAFTGILVPLMFNRFYETLLQFINNQLYSRRK